MYNDLVMFRNELKNKIIPKYKLIGIVVELVLSRELFPKNSDLKKFTKNIFSIEYKEYVMKSRTMILARLSRLIEQTPDKELNEMKKKLYDFILLALDVYKSNGKTNAEKNPFSGWLS